MPTIVFGPHATGLNALGLHIPLVTTEVDRGDSGTVPGNLTIKGSGPLGQHGTCSVANGQTMTVTGIGSLNAVYLVNDCRTEPASGSVPAQFKFRITIRAEGSVSIALVPIPINIQVDSFEVAVPT